MKLLKPGLWLASLPALLLLLATACGGGGGGGGAPSELKTDFGVSATEIKLGMTIVQSGNLAAVYQPIAPAMKAYFSKVNQEDGGVCDRQISLLVEDDQYAPGPSLEKAKKLAELDQVVAFVGNLGTPPVTGQVDYINDPNGDGDTADGIPQLFVSTGASKWGDYQKWPWTIGYIPDYTSEGGILAAYVNKNLPDKTVGILYQNDDFGKGGYNGFKEAFEGEIVAEQTYESTATEITSQIANLNAANPDIVYLYSTPAFTAQVFRYMKANNWKPQVVQSYVNAATTLASLVGGGREAAQIQEGFQQIAGTISTNYLLDPVADKDAPALVEHKRILDTYSGGSVGNLSVYAQSLAELVVETLKRACDNGDMTRAGVLKAAESIKGFRSSVLLEGIEFNLGATDHFAIQALVPIEVQADGVLKPLGETISVE